MAKHKYEMIINNPCKSKDAVYDYGNIKNISLAVNNQKAHQIFSDSDTKISEKHTGK